MAGSISVTEDDFVTLAGAAKDAQTAGDHEQAVALDKLARKVNLALTTAGRAPFVRALCIHPPKMTWQDMPSTLEAGIPPSNP